MKKEDCIFCNIAADEMPADVVYRDELVTAFRDINPVAPTHILIIPNEHIQDSNELDEDHKEVAAQMLSVISDIAKAEGINESGYRLIMNTGPDAYQHQVILQQHVVQRLPNCKIH